MMKKNEMLDQIVESTGMKKRVARKALDAAFLLMHEKLKAGEEVVIPPLGRVKLVTKGEGEEAKTSYKLILATEKEVADAAADAEPVEA